MCRACVGVPGLMCRACVGVPGLMCRACVGVPGLMCRALKLRACVGVPYRWTKFGGKNSQVISEIIYIFTSCLMLGV